MVSCSQHSIYWKINPIFIHVSSEPICNVSRSFIIFIITWPCWFVPNVTGIYQATKEFTPKCYRVWWHSHWCQQFMIREAHIMQWSYKVSCILVFTFSIVFRFSPCSPSGQTCSPFLGRDPSVLVYILHVTHMDECMQTHHWGVRGPKAQTHYPAQNSQSVSQSVLPQTH